MEVKKLSKEFSTVGQISTDDLPLIHAMGFRSLICNRPDGESLDQQLFESIEKAATNVGMQSRYIPIDSGGAAAGSVAAMRDAFDTMPKPILAYCRSGDRSEKIYNEMVSRFD